MLDIPKSNDILLKLYILNNKYTHVYISHVNSKNQIIRLKMIDYPNILDKIFDKLIKNNAKPIIVGGYVRDSLLGVISDDIDIEVYNISSFDKLEEILQEFGDVNSVGKSFGVCKLSLKNLSLDFTLPRLDSKISSGHTGFDIKIDKNLDFTTASSRRDFTINAIGFDVKDKKLLDPFNGVNDLDEKLLKMVDTKSFVEDPLRVLRAVQFCARFDLKMDTKLFSTCRDMIDENLLLELPKERIYGEIKKLLLKSSKPSLGFEILKQLNALSFLSPSSSSLKAIDYLAKHKTTNKKTDEVLMLSALCYSFSPKQLEEFINKLSNDKELFSRILSLINTLHVVLNLHSKSLSDYDIYKLATRVKIDETILLSSSLYGVGSEILSRAKKLHVEDKMLPAIIGGKDLINLGMKPSKEFSKILQSVYDAQMRGVFDSHDEAIVWLKKFLLSDNTHFSL